MIRGYSTLGDSADRMCQTSVWICKEQALPLVSRGILLYILIERTDLVVSFCDDSQPYKWPELASAHRAIIYQGLPLVLVDRSVAVRDLSG
jgi:hypothetical protein